MEPEVSENDVFNLVLIHFIRSTLVLEQALSVNLEADDFLNIQEYSFFAPIYSVLKEYRQKVGGNIPKTVLLVELELKISSMNFITPKTRKRAEDLIDIAYSFKDDELDDKYILIHDGPLQKLINRFKVHKVIANINNKQNFIEILDKANKLVQSTRVARPTELDIFNDSTAVELSSSLSVRPTGVDWIDIPLGGLPSSCFIGHLAESGGCKTMAGVQLAVELAIKKIPTVVFYYEQSVSGNIAARYYSYATQTPMDILSKLEYVSYPDDVKNRIAIVKSAVGPYLRTMDMSGADPSQGSGGIAEVYTHVKSMKRRGFDVQAVIIDWLGDMVLKDSSFKANGDTALQSYIQKTLTQCNSMVRSEKILLYVLHQLAPGAVEGKRPVWQPDYTSAMGCKSFGHLMEYVFTFGRMCRKSNCMWFCKPKTRFGNSAPTIVRVDAPIGRIMHDAKATFSPMPNDDTYFISAKNPKAKMGNDFGELR